MYNTILNCSQYHVAIAAMYIPIFMPCFFSLCLLHHESPSIHFPCLCICPLPLYSPPQKKKRKRKKEKKKKGTLLVKNTLSHIVLDVFYFIKHIH